MYWNDNHYCPPRVLTKFRELEEEMQLPLRVLYGSGRTVDPGRWTATQRSRALGSPSAAEARENGITIVCYGSLNTTGPARYITAFRNADTPGVWANPDIAGYELYDVVSPREVLIGEPYHVFDELVGEIGERTITTHIAIHEWGEHLNWDLFIRDPLMASLDDEARAAWREKEAERSFKAFCELMKRGSNEGLAVLEGEINMWMQRQSEAVATAARAKTALRDRQLRVDQLRADTDEEAQQASREESWQRLLEHPKVEKVILRENKIQLDTVDLTITHPNTGQVAPLGKFRWTMDPVNYSCRIENLTNKRGGHDHPHVSNGSPCFGDMGDAIWQLVNKGDLYTAVEFIFVFLESINLDDDWGRRASYWFDEAANERFAANPDIEFVDEDEPIFA